MNIFYVIQQSALKFVKPTDGKIIPENDYCLKVDILDVTKFEDVLLRLYFEKETIEGWLYNGMRFIELDSDEDIFDGRFNQRDS